MALTTEQIQKIWLISDTVLYPEAVRLIGELDDPLPNNQMMGLLNIAQGERYAGRDGVQAFIVHQHKRFSSEAKSETKAAIGTFYTELEKYLSDMRKQRIREKFQLVTENPIKKEADQEVDEVMLWLARDFIQHLIAENGVLAAKKGKRG